MLNDPYSVALIAMAAVIVYLVKRLLDLDADLDNLMDKHNDFVVVTQENTKIFRDAITELALAMDEILDELESQDAEHTK